MMDQIVAILDEVAAMSRETRSLWLVNFITCSPTEPNLSVPPTYYNPAEYLAYLVQDEVRSNRLAETFGNTAFEILKAKIEDPQKPPLALNSQEFKSLQYLIGVFPTSNTLETVGFLQELLRNQGYKKWPTEEEDVYPDILLAVAGCLQRNAILSHSEILQLIKEPSYAVQAFSVLLRLAPDRAIQVLPQTLELLINHGGRYGALLFDLSRIIGDRPQDWESVAQLLGDKKFEKPIEILKVYIEKSWELNEIASKLKEDWNGTMVENVFSPPAVSSSLDSKHLTPFMNYLPNTVGRDEISLVRLARFKQNIPQFLQRLDSKRPNDIGQVVSYLFDAAEKHNENRFGEDLGRKSAVAMLDLKKPPEYFQHLWEHGIYPASFLRDKPQSREFGADALRHFCSYSVWLPEHDATSPNQVVDKFYSESKYALEPEYQRLGLRSLVTKLCDDAKKLKLPVLRVAISEFPEDRWVTWLVSLCLKMADQNSFSIVPCPSVYGTIGIAGHVSAHVALINELSHGDVGKLHEKVLRHSGYSVYARIRWLEDLKKAVDTPQLARVAINELIAGKTLEEVSFAAKVWIACKGGLGNSERHSMAEFDVISQKILEIAKKFDSKCHPDFSPETDIAFDDRFRKFIIEQDTKMPIFAGGSIHNRLIERWFINKDNDGSIQRPILKLLDEKDFCKILDDKWPIHNYLAIGNELTKLETSTNNYTEFISSLTALYKKVCTILSSLISLGEIQKKISVATSSHKDSLIYKYNLTKNLIMLSVPQPSEFFNHNGRPEAMELLQYTTHFPGSRWSYLSHPDDFIPLIKKDNNFNLRSDDAGGKDPESKKLSPSKGHLKMVSNA